MGKDPKTSGETEGASQPKGYGKRSLWQWILIYLVLAIVLYGAIYYFVVSRKGYTYGDEQSGSYQVTYPRIPY